MHQETGPKPAKRNRLAWLLALGGLTLCALAAFLLYQTINLKARVSQLESSNRELLLDGARREPAYKAFISRFPKAVCVVDSGVARWSASARQEGKIIGYLLEFDSRRKARLYRVDWNTKGQSISTACNSITIEQFLMLVGNADNQ